MRTTVALPPALHARARQIAEARGQSLSAVVSDLAARGLIQPDEPATIRTDERSGFPVLSHVQGQRQVTDAYLVALASSRQGAGSRPATALAAAHPGTTTYLG